MPSVPPPENDPAINGPAAGRQAMPVVDPSLPSSTLRVMTYGPKSFHESSDVDLDSLGSLPGAEPVTWLDVSGLGDASELVRIGEALSLHRLVVEDIAHVRHRPKAEVEDDEVFIVARRILPGSTHEMEQLGLVVREGLVASFQERPSEWADPIRTRVRRGRGHVRESGADYLAYALLDAAVDSFIPATEDLADELDHLDRQVLEQPSKDNLTAIHRLRRRLVTLRRHAVNQAEAVSVLLRSESPLLDAETRTHLRDVLDYAQHVVELLRSQAEMANSLMDFCTSLIGQKMNEIMKVLTVIASVFIPLSFIASVFGMNFERTSPWNMPELGWRYGYLTALGLMLGVALVMLAIFRRQGWLGAVPPAEPEEDPDRAG